MNSGPADGEPGVEIWRPIWSKTPNERVNRESAAAPMSSDLPPHRPSILRFVGAVMAEQHDEWADGRRYLGLDVLARPRAVDTTTEETTTDPETHERVRHDRVDLLSTRPAR